ncbi:4Fe-4S binding protein [Pleomorphomonas koreensis]|uniref:4Fe-4S binding protein n=1 Tax=Pleomorphomonas koreensis TaxID=257440 RepID=UPI00041C120E|nr:4Fe-4S binding protein [Pleomorphomonas koreensis]
MNRLVHGDAFAGTPVKSLADIEKVQPPGAFTRTIEALFVGWRRHFGWIQVLMFVVFLVVIGLPLLMPDPPAESGILTNPTLFLRYMLWGIWFPLVFLSVIVLGRLWCGTLCPMGAASELANKYGLQRAIPGWIKWEGTPALSFIIMTLYGQTLGVRDHPEAAAGLFGGTMLLAIAIGGLYGRNKRVWCRHLCPIGRVLGLYSRLGAVQFAPKVLLGGGDAYTERGACPTMIDLPRKRESRHCIECFRCVNPKAAGSMRLELRRPGVEVEEIRDHRANKAEAWFLFLDTGVALGGFLWLVLPQYQQMRQGLGVWAIQNHIDWITRVGPSWLMSVHPARAETFLWLDFLMIVGFMLGTMAVLTVVLACLTAVGAMIARKLGADGGFGQVFTELGYQYAPVALMSLIIGLGAELLNPLRDTAIGIEGVHVIRGGLFLIGVVWSIWLGDRILKRQGIDLSKRWLPLLPGIAGSLFVGFGWWPAIFGL